MTAPLLRVENLTKHFPVTAGMFGKTVGQIRAVDGVSFDIARGETLGLVGESGCGKTTVGRAILRLSPPTSGRISYDGTDVTNATPKELLRLRRQMQIVFQDPFGSLNPRLRVKDIVGEALEVHGIARGAEVEQRVADVLDKVGIARTWMNRYPHEFSGGQRQRIGIARAIAVEPRLIVCDEAVSALDVSVQAQVINLLLDLRREMGLSYLFIAHDLSVVRHLSHRIAVMYLGEIVEMGPGERLFSAPCHPYTRALLSAIPIPDPRRPKRRLVLTGDVPTPLNPPSGCRFHTRCPAVVDRCPASPPPVVEVEPGHRVQCVHAEGLAGATDFFERISERIDTRIRERTEARPPAEAPEQRSPAVATPSVSRESSHRETSEPEPFSATAAPDDAPQVTKPRSRWPLFVALALVALSVVPVWRWNTRRAEEKRLATLAAEIEDYARNTGHYPRRLSDLGFRLYPVLERGAPVDAWGRPLLYRVTEKRREFVLSSLGRDGAPSTDDIVVTGPRGSEHPHPKR